MKVAVTGASGHVGNVLCRELIRRGVQVKALVHQNEDDLDEIGVAMVRGDILDPDSIKELFTDADVIYHLAARISIDNKNRDLIYATNVEGTRNVINACLEKRGVKLVHFSTIHTFGTYNAGDVLDENSSGITHSSIHYENSKASAEQLVLEAASKGLHAVVLNPTAIIGPYDYQPSYLGQALIKMYKNQLPMLVEGGYDLVDVRDVVEAAIQAADKGRAGERYIISGKWLSLVELSRKIGEVTGKKTPSVVAPSFLARIGLPFIHAWAALSGTHPLYTAESLKILKHSSRNISGAKAYREFGLEPRSIEDSIRDIFAWFEQNKMV